MVVMKAYMRAILHSFSYFSYIIGALLQLGSHSNVSGVLEADALRFEHGIDVLVGRSRLLRSHLDVIRCGIILSKHTPIRIESLDHSHISTTAHVPFHDVGALKAHILQPLQRIALATQKAGHRSQQATIARCRIQGIVRDAPLRIGHGHESLGSRLRVDGFDRINGLLRGLHEAADIVLRSGLALRDPKPDAIHAGFVDGAVLIDARWHAASSVARIFAQHVSRRQGCHTVQLHDATLPGLIRWHEHGAGHVDVRIILNVLQQLIVVGTAWQEHADDLSCDAGLVGILHGGGGLTHHLVIRQRDGQSIRDLLLGRSLGLVIGDIVRAHGHARHGDVGADVEHAIAAGCGCWCHGKCRCGVRSSQEQCERCCNLELHGLCQCNRLYYSTFQNRRRRRRFQRCYC
mmetsp:Transcript_16118/g.44656  ORF Transcript_16118/g.44656 Transcript_16118/m.44656 type:complete len:404 (+) Transcript_16118:619-1830(+)